MELCEPKSHIHLVKSAYLKVIKLAGYSSNLSLSTQVIVNTNDNTTKVKYYVNSWSYKHKRINKYFDDYKLALEYYNKLYTKFARIY